MALRTVTSRYCDYLGISYRPAARPCSRRIPRPSPHPEGTRRAFLLGPVSRAAAPLPLPRHGRSWSSPPLVRLRRLRSVAPQSVARLRESSRSQSGVRSSGYTSTSTSQSTAVPRLLRWIPRVETRNLRSGRLQKPLQDAAPSIMHEPGVSQSYE